MLDNSTLESFIGEASADRGFKCSISNYYHVGRRRFVAMEAITVNNQGKNMST